MNYFKHNFGKSFPEPAKGTTKHEPKFDKPFSKPTNSPIKYEPKVDKSSPKPENNTVKHEPKVDKSSPKPENNTVKHEPKVDKSYPKPENNTVQHEVLLSFPNCIVHLVGSKEAVEIANGDFSAVKLLANGVAIATVIKVGKDLQWPLTKDEPVVKLDSCNYLFSLPMRGGEPLSYGVSFVIEGKPAGINLSKLDEFLKGNSCFSIPDSSAKVKGVNWKDYAPKVDDFNSFLAKAIANGTGKLVKGIFMCSNAYSSKIQKAGQSILAQPVPEKKKMVGAGAGGAGGAAFNVNLKRVRELSKMIEEMSKGIAEGMGIAIGSALAPVIQSEQGKKFLNKVPGQVLLVSQDALNRVMEAAEIATKLSLNATTASATKILSERFGGDMGEAAEDAFATAESLMNTAWNIFKMRKAINPTSVAGSGLLLKNALRSITLK